MFTPYYPITLEKKLLVINHLYKPYFELAANITNNDNYLHIRNYSSKHQQLIKTSFENYTFTQNIITFIQWITSSFGILIIWKNLKNKNII